MSFEGREQLSRACVPQLRGVIAAAGQHAAAVRRERDRGEGFGMPREGPEQLSSDNVPQLRGIYEAPRQRKDGVSR